MELNIYRTIRDVNHIHWDEAFSSFGIFDVKGLLFLEEVCSTRADLMHRWDFYYICIYDNDRPVLLTFFTSAIWKLDIFSPTWVSEQVEKLRSKRHPLFLSERILTLGSLLTEGNHLYVDYQGQWKQALHMLTNSLEPIRVETESEYLFLRDFPSHCVELNDELLKNGFFKDSVVLQRAVLHGNELTFDQWKRQCSKNFRTKVINRLFNIVDKKYKWYFSTEENKENDPEMIKKIQFEIDSFIERKKVVNLYPMPGDFIEKWIQFGFDIVAILDRENNVITTVIYRKIKNHQSYLFFLGFKEDFKEEFSVCLLSYIMATKACFDSGHSQTIFFGMEKNVEKTRMGCTFEDHYCFVKISKWAMVKHLTKQSLMYCYAILSLGYSKIRGK